MSYTFNVDTVATVARALELDRFHVKRSSNGEIKVAGIDRWNNEPTSIIVTPGDNGVTVTVWQDGEQFGCVGVPTGDITGAYRLAYDMAELNIAR